MPTPEEIVNRAMEAVRTAKSVEEIPVQPPIRKVSDIPVYKVTDPAIAEAIRVNELRQPRVETKWDKVSTVLRNKGMDSKSQIDALVEIREILGE